MTDVNQKIVQISDDISNWRQKNGISVGQELTASERNSLIEFTYACIDRMGYELDPSRSNAVVIPYTADADHSGLIENLLEVANCISKQSPEAYMYISDTPAGKFVNSLVFKEALKVAAGSKEIAEIITCGNYILQVDKWVRTSWYAYETYQPLIDYLSGNLMAIWAHGDVKTLSSFLGTFQR